MRWGNNFWSPICCIVSCDEASLDEVAKYVETYRKPPLFEAVNHSKVILKGLDSQLKQARMRPYLFKKAIDCFSC